MDEESAITPPGWAASNVISDPLLRQLADAVIQNQMTQQEAGRIYRLMKFPTLQTPMAPPERGAVLR